MTENIIINILTLLAGGGLGWLINWRANKRKANGEAIQTEAEAMKSAQDFYQQALKDQQDYITQLTDVRDHLIGDRDEMREEREEIRKENVELRKRLNDMDKKMRQLEEEVQRNRQMGNAMRVWLCGRVGCSKRIQADFGNNDSSEQ